MEKSTLNKVATFLLTGMVISSSGALTTYAQVNSYDENQLLSQELQPQTENALTAIQSVNTIRQSTSDQTYTFNYKSYDSASYEYGTDFQISFSPGFTPTKVSLGEWEKYNDTILVEVLSGKTVLATLETKDAKDVDVSGYENVSGLNLRPTQTLEDETKTPYKQVINFKDLKVVGKIDSTKAVDNVVNVSGSYFGYNELSDKNTDPLNVDEEKGILFGYTGLTTNCLYYTPSKPSVSFTKNTVTYNDTLGITITNINASGNTKGDNVVVSVNLPTRLYVNTIAIPQFDKATCVLKIDKEEVPTTNRVAQINKSISSFTIEITPTEGDFKQTMDMEVLTRNVVNSNGSASISAIAVSNFGGTRSLVTSSDKNSVSFTEKTAPTTPTDPSDPFTPVTPPVIPTPDPTPTPTPSTPSKPSPSTPETPKKEDDVNKLVPSAPVIDTLGLSNKTVASSDALVYDFTNDNDSTTPSVGDSTYDDVAYDVFDVSDADDASKSKSVSKKVESNNKKNIVESIIDAIQTNRAVQIGLIVGGIILIGALSTIFIFKGSKKDDDDDDSQE